MLPLAMGVAILEGVDAQAIRRPLSHSLVRLPIPVIVPATCCKSIMDINFSGPCIIMGL
jgi:hypothetical protein